MKKIFEIPVIEKVQFRISDAEMCAISITSGVTADSGVIQSATNNAVNSMTGN